MRTKPVGIRFDPEKLDFIKGREKLKTNQQVVDLLVNKYWWENKIPVPTHKEAPPLHLKEQIVEQAALGDIGFNSLKTQPESIFSINTTHLSKADKDALMRKYVQERSELTCQEEHIAWFERLEADERLNKEQKQLVKNTH